jgi:iron complex transport system ATP-binding protein
MTDDRNVIAAEHLILKRSGEALLNDLSWRVSRGQHWALLGANGAGKTLLMKILTGYVWPGSGSVELLGERLGRVDLRVLRRRIGWVAKALEELMPGDATVLEVILSGPEASLGLYIDPSPKQIRAAEDLAESFGLTRIIHRQFGLLSSGEKQRALLARAALMQPDLLFLDEPMTNLDMGGREHFLSILDKMVAGPKAPTVILSTHNTLEIGSFMTHALLMKSGTVVGEGTLDEMMRPEPLQKTFDLPLKVEKTQSGRYLAYL